MRPVSDGFLALVRQSHRRAARVVVLDADLNGVMTIDEAVEGSVSTDSDRRRTCSLTLANPDGMWTPGLTGTLAVNGRIRIDRGIYVGGSPEYVSLGVFLIDRPVVDVAAGTLSITGQDRLKLALRSKFTAPTTYDAGIGIGAMVQSIAQDAGMGADLYRGDDAGKTLAYDRSYELGDARVDAIMQLGLDYSLDIYVDADGFLTWQPSYTPDVFPEPAFEFRAGEDATLLGLVKEWNDDRLYNHTLVSGESSDLPPVVGEARDLNPDSPTYNPADGSGPIGDRLYTYTSAMIRDSQQAQDVADALLATVALVEEDVRVPAVVNPSLEAGDTVIIFEQKSQTSGQYLIETLTMPLGEGAMEFTSRKLRDLRSAAPPVIPPVIIPPPPSTPPTLALHGLGLLSAFGTVTVVSGNVSNLPSDLPMTI